MKSTVAVVGAGPIGLEAALHAVHAGHDVQVFERGNLAESVRQWGFVRMFSPFGMNASELGCRRLAEQGTELPDRDELLSGNDYARRYLQPLAELPELAGRIHPNRPVTGISRQRLLKGDLIGSSDRARDGFRLRIEGSGREQIVTSDVVLDCSGVWQQPNPAGAGGMFAIGERDVLRPEDYRIPAPPVRQAQPHRDRILVVGAGYSAATTVVALAEARPTNSQAIIYWRTRQPATVPMVRIDGDPLFERDRLASRANELATGSAGPVDWKSGWVIEALTRDQTGAIWVELSAMDTGMRDTLVVDRVIANVGTRPDRSLIEELQVHECYATHGPMKLAAALLGARSADCLAQPEQESDTLRNPEPGYFQLGARSYGRNPQFLIRIGLEQIQAVLPLIADLRAGEARS